MKTKISTEERAWRVMRRRYDLTDEMRLPIFGTLSFALINASVAMADFTRAVLSAFKRNNENKN